MRPMIRFTMAALTSRPLAGSSTQQLCTAGRLSRIGRSLANQKLVREIRRARLRQLWDASSPSISVTGFWLSR